MQLVTYLATGKDRTLPAIFRFCIPFQQVEYIIQYYLVNVKVFILNQIRSLYPQVKAWEIDNRMLYLFQPV